MPKEPEGQVLLGGPKTIKSTMPRAEEGRRDVQVKKNRMTPAPTQLAALMAK